MRGLSPRGSTPGYVAVGRVLAPHGLKGEFRAESLTDFPERFHPGGVLYISGTRHEVERSRWHGSKLYLKLAGLDDLNDILPLRDRLLETPEGELQPLGEDSYYHFQLIGLNVVTTSGKELGVVADILSTGSNDVLIVRPSAREGGDKAELLLPAIKDVVKKVDLEAHRIEVELLEGLASADA